MFAVVLQVDTLAVAIGESLGTCCFDTSPVVAILITVARARGIAPFKATFLIAFTLFKCAWNGVDVTGALDLFVLALGGLWTVRHTFFFHTFLTALAHNKVFALTPRAVAFASLGSFLANVLAFWRTSLCLVRPTHLARVSDA